MSPEIPPSADRHRVPPELDGARLDRALAALIPQRSRSRLAALVRGGSVWVDGETVLRPNSSVRAGCVLEVDLHTEKRAAPTGPTPDLPVLFEDEHLVAIDKPPGLIAHRTARNEGGTVADIASEQFGPMPSVQGEGRPGIVHRLDRLTSGVMVLGRTPEALEALKAQFQARTVAKTYRAIAHGDPRFDSDWIENEIAPLEGHFDRYRAVPDSGHRPDPRDELFGDEGEFFDAPTDVPPKPVAREASTYYEVLERFRGFVSLLCKPKTGRTHQIRVHLLGAGLPIVGDRQYGPRGGLKVPLPGEAPKLGRQALHAQVLELDHPASGERMRFEAPLPADLVGLLDWLRREMPAR